MGAEEASEGRAEASEVRAEVSEMGASASEVGAARRNEWRGVSEAESRERVAACGCQCPWAPPAEMSGECVKRRSEKGWQHVGASARGAGVGILEHVKCVGERRDF